MVLTAEKIPECVLDDPDRFKLKAEIGDKAFVWLRKVDKLDEYLKALTTGTATALGVIVSQYLSMGLVGKVLALIGVSTISWPLAVAFGLGTATATLATVKLVKRGRKKFVDDVPKFVSCPLDALAASIAEILLPPCVLLTDRSNRVRGTLAREWGYNRKYLDWLSAQIVDRPAEFSLTRLAVLLRDSRLVMKHVECDGLVKQIEYLASEVTAMRGTPEDQLYDAFKRYLARDKTVTLETVRLLEQVVLGHDVVIAAPAQSPRLWSRVRRCKTTD